MIRKIVEIDEAKCTGCGLCAEACHEGAIAMIDGKAHLIKDDYCDGLGDCLPHCPADAIKIIEREAADYDAAAVAEHMSQRAVEPESGCPGSRMRVLQAPVGAPHVCPGHAVRQMQPGAAAAPSPAPGARPSQLRNWPVQIQLAPLQAPYFDGARLLIAADCTAYAYAGFHEEFLAGRTALIGCPKLDPVDYSEKLTAIIARNAIKDVTVVRMEVPCCGGLVMAVQQALRDSGKVIPWQVVTISCDGQRLAD